MMLKHGPSSDVMDVRFSIEGVIPINIPNSLAILRSLLIPVIVGFENTRGKKEYGWPI